MGSFNSLAIREHLIKNCGFKPFNQVNWYAYSGSEKFEDGSDPIIRQDEDFDVIYDRNGFSFETENDSICFDLDKNGRICHEC